MRKPKQHSQWFLCWLINLLFNLDLTIPAWILLGLHVWCGFSVGWFWLALGVWPLITTFWMLVFSWANHCGTPEVPKENKNPYSVKSQK